MSEGILCNRPGCRNYAKHQVYIRAVALKGRPSAEICTSLVVCDEHQTVTLNDLHNRETWKLLQQLFLDRGFMAPKFELSYSFLKPLDKDNPYVDPATHAATYDTRNKKH